MSTSEENEQLSKQLNRQKVGSSAKNSPRIQGDAGNCRREHSKKVRNDVSRRTTSRTLSERAGFVRTVSKEMYCTNGEECGRWIGESYCIMPRVHFISDPSYKYTEIGHVLDVNVICHH